ncbi:MAG: hypothetical protein AB8G22_07655 [Saprospiraceae bacterium]
MSSNLLCYFFLFIGLVCASTLPAQINIESVGQWDAEVSQDAVLDAGLDFVAFFESMPDQAFFNIFVDDDDNGRKNFKFRVDVHREDIDWHPNLLLYLRRTGNGRWRGTGQANGLLKNGTDYQLLTTSPTYFLNGLKNRYDVPIQFRMEGASVLLPAKTYSTNVVYTVTEL